jgi:hypothetical protein
MVLPQQTVRPECGLTRISHKRSAARPESTMPAVLQPQKASSKYFNMSVGFLTL